MAYISASLEVLRGRAQRAALISGVQILGSKHMKTGTLIAGAVAGLFAMGAFAADKAPAKDAKAGGDVKCAGVNECKGKGGCAGADNSCAGKNGCKGKGVMSMTEADCKAKGGTVAKADTKAAPKK